MPALMPRATPIHDSARLRILEAYIETLKAENESLKRQFPAFVVEVLEPVEAVPAVAHDLARLADVAELLGQFEQAGPTSSPPPRL
jgi:hypothetical protein